MPIVRGGNVERGNLIEVDLKNLTKIMRLKKKNFIELREEEKNFDSGANSKKKSNKYGGTTIARFGQPFS